jgi:hypothetical protein
MSNHLFAVLLDCARFKGNRRLLRKQVIIGRELFFNEKYKKNKKGLSD